MALQMTNRETDGAAVVALDGRMVLGEESSALRQKVKDLLASGKKKIVLNVDRVEYIDSAGVGMLVAVYHTAKSHVRSPHHRQPEPSAYLHAPRRTTPPPLVPSQ